MNEAVDMARTIAPKSDQLNADDLIAGPRTVTVTRVTGNDGNGEQPVNVFFDGDGGKPFRPCKSMRRVMVHVWGRDASQYPGKSMTIYRDPKVQWGGMEVGGIRISHMSGIDKKQVMSLMMSKKARKPYEVLPLADAPAAKDGAKEAADKIIANIERAPDADKLKGYLAGNAGKVLENLRADRPELAAAIDAARDAAFEKFGGVVGADDQDPFADAPDPKEAKLETIKASIAAARITKGLDAVAGEWAGHRSAYDDHVQAEVDALVAARRSELG